MQCMNACARARISVCVCVCPPHTLCEKGRGTQTNKNAHLNIYTRLHMHFYVDKFKKGEATFLLVTSRIYVHHSSGPALVVQIFAQKNRQAYMWCVFVFVYVCVCVLDCLNGQPAGRSRLHTSLLVGGRSGSQARNFCIGFFVCAAHLVLFCFGWRERNPICVFFLFFSSLVCFLCWLI